MKELWYDVEATDFIPNDVVREDDALRAIQFFKQNADYQLDVANLRKWHKEATIKFDENDIDLCEKCVSFNKKLFKLTDVPDFPRPDCTNPNGCIPQLDLDHYNEIVLNDDDVVFDDSEDEDPLTTLRKLKQMLSEGLIDQAEFDTKKTEILARM